MSFERLPTGRGIRCSSCGGSLSAAEAIHERLTRCPHCGVCEELPADLRAELEGHHVEIVQGLDRIVQDRQSQAVIEAQLALRPRHYVLLIAPLFAFTAPTIGLQHFGVGIYALSLLGGWVAYFAYLSWVWPRISKSARGGDVAATIASSGVLCPTCGGENDLRVDATVSHCRFCDGALSPDRETLARIRERMRRAEGAAEQERRKTEWRAAAKNNRDPRTDRVPVVLAGFFVALFVLAGLTALVRIVFIDGPSEEGASPGALVSIVIVPSLLYGLWLRRRRRFTARIDQAVIGSAALFQGEVERHPRALARWLGEHWIGAFDPRRVCAGRHYAAIWGTVGGIPVFVSSCPFTEKHTLAHRHLRVVLASPTERPLMAVREAALSAIEALRKDGLEARVFAEGWVVEATPDRLDRLGEDPEAGLDLRTLLAALPALSLASTPQANDGPNDGPGVSGERMSRAEESALRG